MLNIFVHFVLLLNVEAFFFEETYRTRGLKVIELDLDKHNEFIIGQSMIRITLESSGQGSQPILSYCPTDNVQSIKTILSSTKQIISHIESKKKLCVFDNDAVIFEQQLQGIQLSDSLNKENQWIYNRFSIYNFENRKISLYIHSEDESLYTVKITDSWMEQCINGSNSSTFPSFCICDQQYYASACQITSTLFSPDKQLQLNFVTKSKSVNIITIPLNENALQLDVHISSEANIESIIGCYLEKEYLPFSGSLGYDLHSLQQGLIKFHQADVQECHRIYNQINKILDLQLEPKLTLLVNNLQERDISVNVYIDQLTQENVDIQLDFRIIVFTGLLLFLIVFIIIIYCVKLISRKDQLNCNINNQRRQVVNSHHKKQLSLDFIPSITYEQLVEQYPALKEVDCQICLIEFEKNDLVQLTYCLHIFHSACLKEWRQKNQICPFCRDELTKSKYQEHETNNRIYQLGVVENNEIIIDEKKQQQIEKREERLKQLKIQPSYESVTSIQEVSPSPQQQYPLKPK